MKSELLVDAVNQALNKDRKLFEVALSEVTVDEPDYLSAMISVKPLPIDSDSGSLVGDEVLVQVDTDESEEPCLIVGEDTQIELTTDSLYRSMYWTVALQPEENRPGYSMEALKSHLVEHAYRNSHEALSEITGLFVGLTTALVDINQGEGQGAKTIDFKGTDTQRPITIHPLSGKPPEPTISELVQEEISQIESLVCFDPSNDEINSTLAKVNELNALLTDLATDVEELACRIDDMHHEEDEDEEE